MNRTPDIERVLRAYLADDGITAPDALLDIVERRIGRQPQRRSWRLLRRLPMHTPMKLTAAAAAVIVLVAVGATLLPRQPGVGDPGPSPTPSASPSPTSGPTPSPISCEDDLPGCSGLLAAGTHRSTHVVPPVQFEITGGSWTNVIDLPTLYKIDPVAGSAPSILVWTDASIADQAVPCSSDPDPTRGRAAADWVEFVTTHPGLVVTDSVEVSFSGRTARQLELTVAEGWTQTCPDHEGPYVTLLTQRVADGMEEYGLPADARLLLTVVDIGMRTVVIQSYGPRDGAAFDQAMEPNRAIIDSFVMCGPGIGFGPCSGPGAQPSLTSESPLPDPS